MREMEGFSWSLVQPVSYVPAKFVPAGFVLTIFI